VLETPPMDVHHLRCFLAVAEELHFGRAAERLHLSPSPVSRTVKELEQELGVELFVRSYHSVTMTVAGVAMLEPAREILRGFAELPVLVQLATSKEAFRLRLGGAHLAPPVVLDAVLATISGSYPDVAVQVVSATSAELLTGLANHDLDLAVVHLPVQNPDLEVLELACYRLSLAMRSDDPLAGASELSLSDIVGRTMIMQPAKLQPLTMRRLRDCLEAAGVTQFHEMTDWDVMLVASAVRRTRELALTPASSRSGTSRVFDDPAFSVIPLKDEGMQFRLGIAWQRSTADATLTEVVETLRSAFDQHLIDV
jgi:DNA-binding transcriptional LysR family regulator